MRGKKQVLGWPHPVVTVSGLKGSVSQNLTPVTPVLESIVLEKAPSNFSLGAGREVGNSWPLFQGAEGEYAPGHLFYVGATQGHLF